MNDNKLVRLLTPEEEELQRKIEELRVLEEQLPEIELELSSLQAELDGFFLSVNAALAEKLYEQASLRSKISQATLQLDPENKENQRENQEAQKEFRDAEQDYETFRGTSYSSREAEASSRNRNSEEFRSLYIKLVKLAHPDLTTDPKTKEKRGRFMQRVNAAYGAGDMLRLQQLFMEWDSSPESVQGEGIATELVRLIRQISQVKQRIADGKAEMAKIKESDNYLMFLDAESQGFAEYLKALATTLDNEIDQAMKVLDKLLNNASEKLDV